MTTPIVSTSQLQPDGIAGYRKGLFGIVAGLGAILAAIQPYLPADTVWARWCGIALGVVGSVGVILAPNKIKPTPPAPVDPPPADGGPVLGGV